MSLQSLLTDECELSVESYTTNAIGEEVREFGTPVTVKCRVNANRSGTRDDLRLGGPSQDNVRLLYLSPDTTITTAYRVTHRDINYKVNRVDPFYGLNGDVHHLRCEIEDIRNAS